MDGRVDVNGRDVAELAAKVVFPGWRHSLIASRSSRARGRREKCAVMCSSSPPEFINASHTGHSNITSRQMQGDERVGLQFGCHPNSKFQTNKQTKKKKKKKVAFCSVQR
jgi:hypothetical protein